MGTRNRTKMRLDANAPHKHGLGLGYGLWNIPFVTFLFMPL